MERVLILLEDKDIFHLPCEWLANGYEVVFPHTGDELNGPFDLCILDVAAMSRFSEKMQNRKQAEGGVFLPSLLIASRQDLEKIGKYLGRTVDEFIMKPVEQLELRMRVEALLRRRRTSLELGLQYMEAMVAAEKRADEMDAVFAALTDMVIVFDADGFPTKVTPAAVWACGFDPIGISVEECLRRLSVRHSDGRAAKADELPSVKALRGVTTINERFIFTNPKGREFIVNVSSSPIHVKGQISGAVSVWHDVTEREKMIEQLHLRARELQEQKEALRVARDELEIRVQERTAELLKTNNFLRIEVIERQKAEEGLKVHMERLEKSNRELKEFAFVASHDLQEPLRKIQVFGDLLKSKYQEALGDEGRDYLERMRKTANRMQDLIMALLNYSRVTTKASSFTAVDLTGVIREVLADLEARIKQTGAIVDVGDLATIEVDTTQIRQLFQNLIGNALKYHGERKPVIRIYGELREEWQSAEMLQKGTYYQVFVEDNGLGFEEQYLDRIFNLFQRLHKRNEYEGTGMGLAICRKIVERHGGSITARSVPGKGSTFIVTLPVKQMAVSSEQCL